MPKQPGSPTGIRPTRRQANAGKTLLDVRRLTAVDMYGRRGGRRRHRLILAEFALAAIDIPLLGLAIALAASSVPRVLLGAYLIGVGLNYVPLALHAISLSRAGRLDAELAGADAGAELRRYTAKQLFIAIPLLGADPRRPAVHRAPAGAIAIPDAYDQRHPHLPRRRRPLECPPSVAGPDHLDNPRGHQHRDRRCGRRTTTAGRRIRPWQRRHGSAKTVGTREYAYLHNSPQVSSGPGFAAVTRRGAAHRRAGTAGQRSETLPGVTSAKSSNWKRLGQPA